VNGGEFVAAAMALQETMSKGPLTPLDPNGGIAKPSGWQPPGDVIREMNRPESYLTSTAYAAPHEANKKEERRRYNKS
jgi:hypothetical protein